MRTHSLVLGFIFLAAGCRSTGGTSTSGSSTAPSSLAACVGGDGGRGAVVAGVDNEFFTATSRQVLRLKPGVEVKGAPAPGAKPRTLTLVTMERGVELRCGCPGGCGETGDGCVYIVVAGSRDAICTGDCEKAGACCSGCGWY